MTTTDHVHIVVAMDGWSNPDWLREILDTALELVPLSHLHLLTAATESRGKSVLTTVPLENRITEPVPQGKSPAIAFAGCQLYRRDPNAIMVFVTSPSKERAAELLRQNFAELALCAELPGAMVSLAVPRQTSADGADGWRRGKPLSAGSNAFEAYHVRTLAPGDATVQTPGTAGGEELYEVTGVYACSVYALMETYRNYAPVDFQIINEIARTWERDQARTIALYQKLTCAPIDAFLLRKIQVGYPTRNCFVPAATASFLGRSLVVDHITTPASCDGTP